MSAGLVVSDSVSATSGYLRHRSPHQFEDFLGVDFVVGGVVSQLAELPVAEGEDAPLARQDDGVILAARDGLGLLMPQRLDQRRVPAIGRVADSQLTESVLAPTEDSAGFGHRKGVVSGKREVEDG